jgi:hypothetical protein
MVQTFKKMGKFQWMTMSDLANLIQNLNTWLPWRRKLSIDIFKYVPKKLQNTLEYSMVRETQFDGI